LQNQPVGHRPGYQFAQPPVRLKSVSHWIGGEVVASASGRCGTVWNPATGEAAAHVDFAGARHAETMFRFHELVDAHRREIAPLFTLEHRKTQLDAMGEAVARGIENIEFACGIPNLLKRY
jgi:malonate-semialdehyde dehydrogenase (acetylating)/methylmalonate-semialdehyde dehydrogenase